MALSKLVIGLIAGVISIGAIGGITAGLVVSRQNAAQNIDSSNDEFNEPSSTNNKENKNTSSSSSNKSVRNSDMQNSMASDEGDVTKQENTENKVKEENEGQTSLTPIQSDSDSKGQQKRKEEDMDKEVVPDKNPKQAEVKNGKGETEKEDKTGTLMSSNVASAETASTGQQNPTQPAIPKADVDMNKQKILESKATPTEEKR